MALVRETGQMPTALQIAERAGYSVRSVFERFPDLTALRIAVTDHAISEARNTGVLRDLDADRLTRIASQVEQRGRGCEHWLPLWRVLTADAVLLVLMSPGAAVGQMLLEIRRNRERIAALV